MTDNNGAERAVHAQVVVVADGLGGRALRKVTELPPPRVARATRVGGQAVLAPGAAPAYAAGRIHMGVARGGYVGIVRLEDDALDVAGAFDVAFVKSSGGLGPAAAAILRRAGLSVPDGLEGARWRGTPPLTQRRPRIAAPRLFVLGDAAGYIEPFTGEGMAWALSSATALAPLVERVLAGDAQQVVADAWQRAYGELLAARQRRCRWFTRLLRSEWLAAAAFRGARLLPAAARAFVSGLNAPPESRAALIRS